MKVISLFVVLAIGFAAAGCRTANNTVIARPGVPMLTLSPFDAPAGSTATEVAKGMYAPNAGKVTIPAGATIVVLP